MADASTFVNKGSFGCVYKPAKACTSGRPLPNTVAKLFYSKREANTEIARQRAVKKYDTGAQEQNSS